MLDVKIPTKEEIKAELEKRYDISENVWFLTESGPNTTNVTNYGN